MKDGCLRLTGHRLAALAGLLLGGCSHLLFTEATPGEAELVGFARLPAATYVPGPVSGRRLGHGLLNGVSLPFLNGQPVQGLSALEPDGPGYLALADNGYGNRANSADAELRLYRLKLDFHTAEGGKGGVRVVQTIRLRDPEHKAGFPIQRDKSRDRVLTGADFDPESMVRDRDGSYFIGEEFGPFLLHVSADGRLLEAPVGLPDPELPGQVLRSPDHPSLRTRLPTAAPIAGARVRRSGGIEGLATFPDGRRLLVALEKPLQGTTTRELLWLEFDKDTGQFTGRHWYYPLSPGAEGIGDIVLTDAGSGYALENGSAAGKGPRLVRRFHLLPNGRIRTETAADLANLADPEHLGPSWPGFPPGRMHVPFTALECLALVDAGTRIIVANDNNFPYGIVRQRNKRRPDDSEFLLIALPDAE